MSYPFRCVVFAAVSSKPQAAEDKDSIPTQIQRARALIEQRGWEEAHEPLVVAGQTRSISWLHEACSEVPAISELVALAQNQEIDLVICRGYDRLARRRALLAQLSEYLSQRRVQIYALDKPVEPVEPNQLGRRGNRSQSAAIIEALSGVQDEEEINRLTQRREFGMNATMRQGILKLPEALIPYGYTRAATNDLGESVLVDVPQIVPEEAALVNRIEELYLSGYSYVRIARLLNGEGHAAPRGGQWQSNTVRRILRNEFYCGLIVWGYRRRESVYDAKKHEFRKKNVCAPVVEELRERIGYLPTGFDLMNWPDECQRDGVIVADGEHDRVRTRKCQRQIYDEMSARRKMGGRAAATDSRCYLFSGLLKCDECGHAFLAHRHAHPNRTYIYYACGGRNHGRQCSNAKYAREDRVYDTIMGTLQEISQSPEAADRYLSERKHEHQDQLLVERNSLRTALISLDTRRGRWDEAYETSVINLASYQERVQELTEQRRVLEYRLDRIQGRVTQLERQERRRDDLLALLEDVPPIEDRQAAKVFFRRAIEEVRIADGNVVEIIL